MAAGAAPPVYACEARDVARKPTSAVTLSANGDSVVAQRLLADAQGNSYIAGSLVGSPNPDFGGGPLSNAGHLFLIKLNATGQHLWSVRFGSLESDQRDDVSSLSFTPNGDILLGANLAFGSDSNEHRFAAMRFDSAGQLLQDFFLDVPPTANLTSVWSVDAELFFALALGAELTVGDTTLEGPVPPDSAWPNYVLHFDAQEELLGSGHWIEDGWLTDVAADSDGNSYLLSTTWAVGGSRSSVRALSRGLETRWQLDLPGPGSRLALGTQLVIAGIEPRAPSDPLSQIFLQRVNPSSGAQVVSHVVPLNAHANADSLQALAVLPDDSVVLGAEGSTEWTVGETPLKSASGSGPLLMQISDLGEPLWATLFCVTTGYSPSGIVKSLAHADGTLRALVGHDDQLEVGLSQPLGRRYDSFDELLTLDLNQAPEGDP